MSEQNQIKAIPDQQNEKVTIINGYEMYENLGKGSFGQVFKAKKDGNIYALKLLDLNMIRQRKIEKFVSNEINLMKKMHHKNVVKIYDTFQTTSVIFLVLEYCNEGTLLTHISKKKPNVEQCVDLFIQILAGVKHIHEKGVLHRDLKPENMFLHNGVLKIADFGLAQFEKDDFVYCGTSFYMAPEILERRQVSYKSDLWSLGIVLFYMIFRRLPFYSKSNLLNIIKQWTDPNFNVIRYFKGQNHFLNLIDLDISEFFKKVLVYDINKRILFKELYNLVLIEKQMKVEDQKESFIFYSNLDNQINQFDRAISPNFSFLDNQMELNQLEDKRQALSEQIIINPSNRLLESTKLPPESSRVSIMQHTNVQIQISSSFNEDIPEDDSPNIQSKYPLNNQTHFDKRRQSQPNTFATLDPTKIYIQPTHFSQQRQSVSFLEQLIPKRFSYEDVLSPNIFSDFEVIQPQKLEIQTSNYDVIQLCSQIKSSIQSFLFEEIKNEFYKEIEQVKQFVYKYQLLEDILDNLSEFRLGYSTQCLMNFIISKIIIFTIQSAQDWVSRSSFGFKRSDVCQKIECMLKNDLQTWENKLLVYRYGIDLENDIKQQNLRDIINDDSTHISFFKDIIQPFCIIFELLFSISYQLSESNNNNDKIRFKRYCYYLLLVINIQYIFNTSKDESFLFEEVLENNKELNPKNIITYVLNIKNYLNFDSLLLRFINFCPLSIPNIKMIEPFSNRKFF